MRTIAHTGHHHAPRQPPKELPAVIEYTFYLVGFVMLSYIVYLFLKRKK